MPSEPQKEPEKTQGNATDIKVPIQHESDINKFLDNQTLRTNPLEKNITAEQIYTRAERISAALYLVTSHIKDTEPVRLSIRHEANELIRRAFSVHDVLRTDTSTLIEDLLGSVRHLVSFVRFLGVSGFLSLSNVSVLVGALDELGQLVIGAKRSEMSEFTRLSHGDLVPVGRGVTSPSRKSTHVRTRAIDAPVFTSRKPTVVEEGGASRTSRIVDFMRSGDLFGIKDIVVNFPEFSEKMVQRELAALVLSGKIKRVGEKRWSKYGLA